MRLEQLADFGVVALFHRGAIAVARVVDQYVRAAAEPLVSPPHGRGDLRGLGDVEGDGEHPLGRGGGQVGDLGLVACGDDGIVAGADDGLGERAAEPR